MLTDIIEFMVYAAVDQWCTREYKRVFYAAKLDERAGLEGIYPEDVPFIVQVADLLDAKAATL